RGLRSSPVGDAIRSRGLAARSPTGSGSAAQSELVVQKEGAMKRAKMRSECDTMRLRSGRTSMSEAGTSAAEVHEAAEVSRPAGPAGQEGPTLELAPQHLALVRGSAIADDVATARGYCSITSRAELRRRGFSDSQCLVPSLLIPVRDVTGELATYQI